MSTRNEDTKIEKNWNKMLNQVRPAMTRCINKINPGYYNDLWAGEVFESKNKLNKLVLITDCQNKFIQRRVIVDTLTDINYIKKSKKWTDKEIIGFLDSILFYTMLYGDIKDKQNEQMLQQISTMFNISVSRLATSVQLFMRNYDKGINAFIINFYFTPTDILTLKYPTIDKLQEAVEENKLSDSEMLLIKEIYNI